MSNFAKKYIVNTKQYNNHKATTKYFAFSDNLIKYTTELRKNNIEYAVYTVTQVFFWETK